MQSAGGLWTGRNRGHGLVIHVRTEVFVLDTSHCVKVLVKELVGPRGDARILPPKEWSNCHEGREVQDEVPGHHGRRNFGRLCDETLENT